MSTCSKILIVDDEPRMCESLRVLLSSQEYEVHTAHSGRDALGQLGDAHFDLAVLDVFMPDMNGHDLMEHILRENGDTLVIMITGNATVDSAVTALKRGAYDFIKKPFEFDEFLTTIQNALEQKRLEHAAHEIHGKLARSEERYQYLVRNSPDIIYTLDPEGRFTFVSDAAQTLLGVHASELIGRHYNEMIAEEDLERCRWHVQERRTGERATKGVELQLKAGTNGGTRLLVGELKSTGMYEQANGPESRQYVGTHGVIRDISRRKQLEVRLEQAGRAEALGTLASGIAHNFNNLLQAIQANASLCLLDMDPESKHYERILDIVQFVDSGAQLTRQLLGFALGQKANVQKRDLNELVHNTATLFAKTRKEIVLHQNLHADLWAAEVDDQQIEQVLMNILVNAWHAMPNGGDLYVETRNVNLEPDIVAQYGLEAGPFVQIRIRDTGVGMDEEVKQRVFEPFFTTREVGEGTGLGMASAYGIIQRHRGLIYVDSEKGQGTTCSICLPAISKGNVEPPSHSSPANIAPGGETVLLVDDDEPVLLTAQELLQALGYTVLAAKSGPEALDLYQERWKEIDLVILDLVMPGMDGGAVFDALKEINPNVTCLLSTGHGLEGPAGEVMKRGCAGYLQKPFDLQTISQEIRKALESKKDA